MFLQLVREDLNEDSTEGKLFINGTFECYTLEDTDRQLELGGKKIYGQTAIPRGIYEIDITYSQRFKRHMPELLNVPQFEGIRIHKGNKPDDTEGCILVGADQTSNADNFIGSSKVAYDKLLLKMKEAKAREEQITIEIV